MLVESLPYWECGAFFSSKFLVTKIDKEITSLQKLNKETRRSKKKIM